MRALTPPCCYCCSCHCGWCGELAQVHSSLNICCCKRCFLSFFCVRLQPIMWRQNVFKNVKNKQTRRGKQKATERTNKTRRCLQLWLNFSAFNLGASETDNRRKRDAEQKLSNKCIDSGRQIESKRVMWCDFYLQLKDYYVTFTRRDRDGDRGSQCLL